MAHNTLVSYGCPDAEVEAHYEDILALYHDLMKMDPAHICYYEDEYSLVLLKQVNLLSLGLSVWGRNRSMLVMSRTDRMLHFMFIWYLLHSQSRILSKPLSENMKLCRLNYIWS